MASLEEELMYGGITNETNQLVLTGEVVSADLEQSIKKGLDVGLKLEPQEFDDGEPSLINKSSKKKKLKARLACPECHRSFEGNQEDKMLRHIRKVHRGENPYQCTRCHYSTYSKAVFEEHNRNHDGIKPFKCSICDYRSSSKKNCKKHELNHSLKKHKCEQCKQAFRDKQELERHLMDRHGEAKKWVCRHCNTKFDMLQKLRYHQKTYVKKCNQCPARLCSKEMRVKHMADEHSEYYYEEANEDKKEKKLPFWTCKICLWESTNLNKTLLHLIHHPNQEVDTSVIDVTPLRKHNILP